MNKLQSFEQPFQPAAVREQTLLAKLPDFINFCQIESAYYRNHLQSVKASSVTTLEQLATIPVTRKSDLIRLQKECPPFGDINAESGRVSRVFRSPGPIFELESTSDDWWRMGNAFAAANFTSNDLVLNCLSYHMTPGGFIMDSGARACGARVIPAGPGQTEQQLEIIEMLRPTAYSGTPSFLNIILNKADEQGRDVTSINKALVTGEALPETLQQEFLHRGILVKQAYASADIGLIAYESERNEGLVVAEDIIVEIVRPGSGAPVANGEIGEVVVTSFNRDYPLIRFATGDLSAFVSQTTSCGRTNKRLKGWLGRADQTAKVKGMFVHPEQIESIRDKYETLFKLRLNITQHNNNDVMSLQCEVDFTVLSVDEQQTLSVALAETLRAVTNLSGTVELVTQGSLANDGKVIDDLRSGLLP
ncbi:phenylacetate--CoA ligase family protein [Psychrobium sp. 1_MG-2023]|uniref:phenylacetate--CoA ligase family protein n=1 Tax=Psychrobium sp. 1_MG-2023 TaxID=3062624 RepID=UPI000C338F94|nr:AMP-binding protein [Psychrobium sp. 1_MG-2023]MDP2560308.1 AMP-binding protein [Psychrobium sp. 1_MG-2023]PKF55495.1 AMP-dependent synthetase [Alteromonadales bacterium alter-6D02]